MSKENEELLVCFIEDVWNRGDIEAIDKYLADRYTIHHDPGDPWDQKTLSIDGFKSRVRTSREPIPDQKFTIQEIFSDDSRVSITWLWRGTHLGEVAGFRASGTELTMSGATVYYFEKGKISGHWQIADRLSIYQQLMATGNAADA